MKKITPEFLKQWLEVKVRESLSLQKSEHVSIIAPHKLRGIPFDKSNISTMSAMYTYTGHTVSQVTFRRAVVELLKEAQKQFTYR